MLLLIVGPPAVGKMTAGTELAALTGLRLLHNHHTIDLALRFFPFGSPPFRRLVGEFRRRILEEVAGSTLPGLIFTYVWAFDDPTDGATVEGYASLFRNRGGRVLFVELEAPQAVRLQRNETAIRLAEKPFKRDLAASRRQLLDADASYQLNSGGAFDGRPDYLRIDTTALGAREVAERILRHFGIPQATAVSPPT